MDIVERKRAGLAAIMRDMAQVIFAATVVSSAVNGGSNWSMIMIGAGISVFIWALSQSVIR